MEAAGYPEMSVNSPRLRGVTLQKLVFPCDININEEHTQKKRYHKINKIAFTNMLPAVKTARNNILYRKLVYGLSIEREKKFTFRNTICILFQTQWLHVSN
jgi:hypothetical protein